MTRAYFASLVGVIPIFYLCSCSVTTTTYSTGQSSTTRNQNNPDYNWYPRYYFHGSRYYSLLEDKPFIPVPLRHDTAVG
jgi:hypothetical protein